MKEFRFRIILIAAAFALSIYLLYPTYSDYENSKHISESRVKIADSIKASNQTITEVDIETILAAKEDANLQVFEQLFRKTQLAPEPASPIQKQRASGVPESPKHLPAEPKRPPE